MTSTIITTDLIDRAFAANLNVDRYSNVARWLSGQFDRKIGTWDPIVRDFIAAAGPVLRERRAIARGALFKAATRHTSPMARFDTGARFEGMVHDAAPVPELVTDDETTRPRWIVYVPSPNGFALCYGVHGDYDSAAEARAAGLDLMLAAGWRRTFAEAQADMNAEIEYRTTHRADGSPRQENR